MIKIRDYVEHYDPSKIHHRQWLEAVLEELLVHEPKALTSGPLREIWLSPSAAVPKDEIRLASLLIREFEGCHLTAYPDPLSGGEPWTIGWGTTTYFDGIKVKKGDTITQEEADAYLAEWLEQAVRTLAKRVPTWGKMNERQHAALLSFSYNLGINWYGSAGFETITAKVKGSQWAEVPAALLLYRNPGTSVEAGLKRRRKAEGDLFRSGAGDTDDRPVAKRSPSSPFAERLTPNIRIGEFALDQEARRFNHQHQVDTAAELAEFLERVRRHFGNKPIIITSGYRPAGINRSVGGAYSSEHLYDAPGVGAVDFYVKGADITAVQDFCDKYWPYSVGYGAPKGFVHIGIKKGRPRNVRWNY
jgi:GH24 family phage-related lysozyme (muramidase)